MQLFGIGEWINTHFHPHLIFYTLVVLFLLYYPPNSLKGIAGVQNFIIRHWGDSVGFYLLHLGVALIAVGGVYKDVASLEHLGESFVLTGVGMLKLKYIPKEDTATTTTTTVASTSSAPVASPTAATAPTATPTTWQRLTK